MILNIMMERYQNLQKADYDNISEPNWPSFAEFCTHNNIPDHVYNDIDRMLNLDVFDHPSFCVLPFVGVEYPSNEFCCLAYKADREKVKQEMIAGIRPSECHLCWKLEDNDLLSDRAIKNSTYTLFNSIEDLYTQAKQQQITKPVFYKIDTSNTCNATCATCSSGDSSAWGALLRHSGRDAAKTWNVSANELDVDYANATHITFRGGEPLLSKENFKILEKLIEHDNTNCQIGLVTNGSIWPTDKQLELLRQFPNLVITLSIDGIGPVFDYMRYPLTWDTMLETLDKWVAFGAEEIGVSYTLSNLNIYYYDETVAWINKNNLNYHINIVTHPECFAPTALSLDVKNYLKQHIQDPGVSALLDSHTEADSVNYNKMLEEVAAQDAMKRINIADYMPEISALIQTA